MFRGLQAQHARNNCQAVLDAVVYLLEQNLVAADCGLEVALVAFTLDRHAQDVGRALQECEIVLDERILGTAVDLQDAERFSVALQDDVHRPAHAMRCQHLRCAKPLLVLEVVRR